VTIKNFLAANQKQLTIRRGAQPFVFDWIFKVGACKTTSKINNGQKCNIVEK